MMNNILAEETYDVFLNEDKVGFIYRKGDVTRFEFAPDYWGNPQRGVLGLAFEDNPNASCRSSMRLPPWFSNLLPEGILRKWIAEARKASVEREMELLAQVGHDLPGAVRVLKGNNNLPSDEIDKLEGEEHSSIKSDRLWAFSLAGVGLKFSMVAQGERLTIPAVGEKGDWIVKLPDQLHSFVPFNERAMMLLAQAVGIEVPETRLVHRDEIAELPSNAWASQEEWAYAVKRFDRGPTRELIHIEDFAQIRGFYPYQKYNGTFETIAALSYRGRDVNSLQEFSRRMVLNILIGNGDAHLKNWSLIYRDRRSPTLSPAYDIVSTFLYRPATEGPEDMGLKFGRTRRFDKVSLETFSNIELKLAVKADLCDIVVSTIGKALAAWPQIESLMSCDPDMARKISEYMNLRAKQFGFN